MGVDGVQRLQGLVGELELDQPPGTQLELPGLEVLAPVELSRIADENPGRVEVESFEGGVQQEAASLALDVARLGERLGRFPGDYVELAAEILGKRGRSRGPRHRQSPLGVVRHQRDAGA